MPYFNFDDEKKEWVQLPPYSHGQLFLDGYLKKKLDNVLELQKNNFDCPFIIVGGEGTGKSTLGFVCGQYLAKNSLTMGNIAEGSSDAMAKLENLPDESVLIVDEAELMFSSRDNMTREQRQLIKILQVIRQKRMVLILISPVLFDLSKYIVVDRSKFVIRTYVNNKMKRGYFCYWGQRKKTKLYFLGKKSYGSYSKPKADFYGRFLDYRLPFDVEYQKLKRRSLVEAFKKDEKKGKKKEKVAEIEAIS